MHSEVEKHLPPIAVIGGIAILIPAFISLTLGKLSHLNHNNGVILILLKRQRLVVGFGYR